MELSKVLSLISMSDLDFPHYLAGGCVRDTLMGVEPKDYDVVVVLPSYMQDYRVSFSEVERYALDWRELGAAVTVYEAYGLSDGVSIEPGTFSDRLWCCLKVEYIGITMDFLYTKAPDIETHVKRHDCNLNQVYFKDGAIVGSIPDSLEWNPDAVVTQERRDYIQGKFDEYIKRTK